MATRLTMIQIGSASRPEKRAMKNEPTTKPTEVSPSWRPYSNSVACSSRSEKGRSNRFHRPNARNMNVPTMNSERMTGVPNNVARPDFRLATMTATDASSSGSGSVYLPMRPMQAAEKMNVPASMMNAHWSPTVLASSPAPANPMAVDPNDAIERKELAAASSSSLAISGIRLSWAGSKNCLTPAFNRMSAYRPGKGRPSIPITTAIVATMTAWTRQVTIMIRFRSWRSTKTPASRPTTRLGTAVAIQGQADGQGGLGHPVDEDAGGQVGQGRAGGGHELGQPQEREVAAAEDAEHRGSRRGRGAYRGSLVFAPGWRDACAQP